MVRGSGATREALLRAAARVVQAEGVTHLTLEAVARTAGVSKGGLLYHFPSKDALIAAMLDDLLTSFEAQIEQGMARDPDAGPGRWLRAYVRSSFTLSKDELSGTSALLAAVVADPALMTPLRHRFAAWQERALADGLDPATATLIRLAADGQWFADLLDLAPLTEPHRHEVLAALLRLTEAGGN